jgi:hypothetical protein
MTHNHIDLPRDIQLHIVKKFDMDTRIKAGMVFKLKVPTEVKERLAAICVPPEPISIDTLARPIFYEKHLGNRKVCAFRPGIYSIRFYDKDSNLVKPDELRRWEVVHISPSGTFSMFAASYQEPWHLHKMYERNV